MNFLICHSIISRWSRLSPLPKKGNMPFSNNCTHVLLYLFHMYKNLLVKARTTVLRTTLPSPCLLDLNFQGTGKSDNKWFKKIIKNIVGRSSNFRYQSEVCNRSTCRPPRISVPYANVADMIHRQRTTEIVHCCLDIQGDCCMSNPNLPVLTHSFQLRASLNFTYCYAPWNTLCITISPCFLNLGGRPIC